MSQLEPAEQMDVARSTVGRWGQGRRLPVAAMITRLAGVPDSDIGTLMSVAAQSDESHDVITVL